MRSPKMAGMVMIRRCFNDEVVAMATHGHWAGPGGGQQVRRGRRMRPAAITQSQAAACRYASCTESFDMPPFAVVADITGRLPALPPKTKETIYKNCEKSDFLLKF